MELVLVGLEVSELGEGLSARVQTTHKRSVVLVHQFMGAVVASLGKLFAAIVVFANKRLFARVRPLVGAQVATLGESLAAARNVTLVRLVASMGSFVDVEMCFLVEALVAAREVALVFEVRSPFFLPTPPFTSPTGGSSDAISSPLASSFSPLAIFCWSSSWAWIMSISESTTVFPIGSRCDVAVTGL